MSADPRRCLLVVAAAGYGKTTALRERLRDAAVVWQSGADIEALVAGGLKEIAADEPDWIVVDDIPRLSTEDAQALLEAATALSGTVGVALASRWPPGAPLSRWRGQGRLVELGPADLALSVDEVAARLSPVDGLAERVHEATGGWPMLVTLTGKDADLESYVEEEILGPLPRDVLRLVRDLADCAPLSIGLGAALGHRRARPALALLARTGVLDGRQRIVPVVAEIARHGRRNTRDRARAAAAWYAEHGPPLAAAQALHRAGDTAACTAHLIAHGDDVLGTGGARDLVALIESMPPQEELRLLFGDALRTAGEVEKAYETYTGGSVGRTEPRLAWRLGLVHYLRGAPRAALDTFARARGDRTADGALLLAWTATAQLLLGECAAAVASARLALARAIATGHDRARATAHIALAVCQSITGDPAGSEEHYGHALRIAERIGDLLLEARVQINRTHRLLADARYPEALATARQAVHAAERAAHANFRSLAVCNEAEALARLGRHDEAVERYEQVIRAGQRMGSRRIAPPLIGLGDAHARRGWLQQARAAYEEALRITGEGGDNQAAVLALAGLARVLVDDPAAARHAEAAAARATGDAMVPALVARGWVAIRAGDRPRAIAAATEAASVARRLRQRASLAEALELHAAAETDPAAARLALAEAHGIWHDAGAPTDTDRVLAALGRLPGASTDDRLNALLAASRLAMADVWAEVDPGRRPVAIRALGRFEVLVDGRPLPASAWQSRKARDLLRILVARRGRAVPRGELSELLWPDDDPTRTNHRLSVLLSIVRSTLDPHRTVATDHFVFADPGSLTLDTSRLRVDVEDFLADVRHALRLHERGADAMARALLAAADQAFTGDAFEDEPYADWTRPLREETRSAHLTAVRLLAKLCRAAGDTDEALRRLGQVLGLDPYDEAAHRATIATLVAVGRHGEARRAFSRYAGAMREIGVRPPPVDLLTAHRSRTS